MEGLLEVDGAGNRFVVWDARSAAAPVDAVAAARRLCAAGGPAFDGLGADGLLLLLPVEGGPANPARARLVVVNRDGSRPEMCGNGLRCIARYLADSRPVRAPEPMDDARDAQREFLVDTDAGPLLCRVTRVNGDWVAAVQIGSATLGEAFALSFPGVPHGLPARSVDVGNPHVVVDATHLGARLADAPLAEVAAAALATGRFPRGVNVELVELHGDHVRARVFERGVGETQACGTGACAVAAVAASGLGLGLPLRVHMPGGQLVVDRDGDPDGPGPFWLSGPVQLGARWPLPG